MTDRVRVVPPLALAWWRLGPAHLVILPFLLYAVPVLAGYGWNAFGPGTPPPPGTSAYKGRRPAVPTSVEQYGTGVVAVPFQARLRAYLRDGDLPLWNPYQGLGQPFAAQGEGSPYFPLAVARSVLPAAWSHLVSLAGIALSSAALGLFLRRLELSAATAAFGAAAWALSGALTLHIARPNILDQLCMLPPLFLAATAAVTSRGALAHVALAVATALYALAGFLQIGVNGLLLLVGFLPVLALARAPSRMAGARALATALVFVGLGLALASPYLIPILEAAHAAYHKNVPYLALIPMPAANVLAFFFPTTFGPFFENWLRGSYPDVVDWNNLYAYGSAGLLVLTAFGCTVAASARRDQRILFLFFVGATVFFLGRYVSLPPFSAVNYVPILSQQSPKHTNGVAAFCLVVAGAFGVEWVRRVDARRAAWAIGAVVATTLAGLAILVGRRGGLGAVDLAAAGVALSATVVLVAVVLAGLWLARSASTPERAALVATGAVVGELATYLPLGNGESWVLALRLGSCGLLVLAGVLAARGATAPAGQVGLVALIAYGVVVVAPSTGLPRPYDVEAVPPYLAWLRQAAGAEYRAFGIRPDYSSLAGVQDIDVVGPLATREYVSFIRLISSPPVENFFLSSSTFALPQPLSVPDRYDLSADYPRARPILDWLGVRYLVLERGIFGDQPGTRTDHLGLLDPSAGLVAAYEDEQVTILESPTAERKVVFATAARSGTGPSALERLRADPRAIDRPPIVEASLDDTEIADDRGPTGSVDVAEYRPNQIRATVDAPRPGILVVKDSYFPGWEATLDGVPTEVVRINGMVRGVVVPTAGPHEVTMRYRPASFVHGVMLASAVAVVLAALVGWGWSRHAHAGSRRRR